MGLLVDPSRGTVVTEPLLKCLYRPLMVQQRL